MEIYYLCIDFVFQFIVEKYRNKLNQIGDYRIKPNLSKILILDCLWNTESQILRKFA